MKGTLVHTLITFSSVEQMIRSYVVVGLLSFLSSFRDCG